MLAEVPKYKFPFTLVTEVVFHTVQSVLFPPRITYQEFSSCTKIDVCLRLQMAEFGMPLYVKVLKNGRFGIPF